MLVTLVLFQLIYLNSRLELESMLKILIMAQTLGRTQHLDLLQFDTT